MDPVVHFEAPYDDPQKVKEAGGKVLGDPMEIPGIGQYVSFNDSEGNRIAMLQPTRENMEKSKARR